MAAQRENNPRNGDDQSTTQPSDTRKPVREVVVTHLDSPPPIGKERIHPRRPAPIVPTPEEGKNLKSDDDKSTE